MQAVHVLRNQPELCDASLHLYDSSMGRIGLLGCDEFPSPVVPFPHESRIASKGFRCRQVLRAKGTPEAFGPSKCGDAAVGGDAGSCDDRNRTGRGQFVFDRPREKPWFMATPLISSMIGFRTGIGQSVTHAIVRAIQSRNQ